MSDSGTTPTPTDSGTPTASSAPPPSDTNTSSGTDTTTGGGSSAPPPASSGGGSVPPSSAAPSDSGSQAAPSSTSATTLSQDVSTVIVTTFQSTSNGQTIFVTSSMDTTLPAGATITETRAAGNKKNNTPAIVGGVVGGVAFLALLALITFFLLRRARKRRLEKEFDGNFDPDRIVGNDRNNMSYAQGGGATLPNITVNDEPNGAFMGGAVAGRHTDPEDEDDGMGGRLGGTSIGGGVVTPYPYQSHPHVGQYPQQSTSPPPMSQYSNYSRTTDGTGYGSSQPLNPGSDSSHAHHDVPHSLRPGASAAGAAGLGAGAGAAAMHYAPSQSATSSSGRGGVIPSAKEREAFSSHYPQLANQHGRGQALYGVANPDQPNEVMVHRDGGRIPEEEEREELKEIPPTYDSLVQGQGEGSSSAAQQQQPRNEKGLRE